MSVSSARTSRLTWAAFLLILATFLTLRLLQAACAVGTFNYEEGFTLSAAWELVNHPVWPYQAYQITDFENGSLIMVLLTAPLTWLLGPSIFVLKLPVILLGGVTLLGLFLVTRAAFGPLAGIIASLLYLFAPSPVFPYNLVNHGFHPDAIPLLLFAMLALLRCAPDKGRAAGLMLAGFLGGFAVYFAFLSAVPLAAILLAWLWGGGLKQHGRRGAKALIIGLLLGVLPILIYNLFNSFAAFQWIRALLFQVPFGEITVAHGIGRDEALDRVLRIFSSFSDSGNLMMAGREELANLPEFVPAFWTVAGLSLLWPWVRQRLGKDQPGPHLADRAALANVFFLPLTFVVLSYEIAPKHMVTVLVLVMIPLAGRLAELWRRGRLPGKAVALALLVAYAANGAYQNQGEITEQRLGLALLLDGRSDPFFAERADWLIRDKSDAWQEARDYLSRSDKDTRDLTDAIGSFPLDGGGDMAGSVKTLVRYLKTLDSKRRDELLVQYGYHHEDWGLRALLDVDELDRETRLRWAITAAGGAGRGQNMASLMSWQGKGPTDGFGHPKVIEAFYQGVGYGVARRMIRPVPRRFEALVPASYRPAFWRGVEEFNRRVGDSLSMTARPWLNGTMPY